MSPRVQSSTRALWELVEVHYASKCADHEHAARIDEHAAILAKLEALAATWSNRSHKCTGGGYDPCLECEHDKQAESCADELRAVIAELKEAKQP